VIVTVTPNPVLDRTLTVPHITFNEVLRATALQLDCGGKGFNVSRALWALGEESVAMGFVGGATGQMLADSLAGLGIATDFTPIAGETRTSTVVVEVGGKRQIKVNEAGPTVTEAEWMSLLDRVRQRVRPGDIWVLSGRLPPGVPPDFYVRVIGLVQGVGARAFLDTSGAALCLGCTAKPHLAKPNREEVEELVRAGGSVSRIDTDADLLDAARLLLRQGIDLVAVSLGERGLLLTSERRTVWARPPRVRVRNVVGAGDALLAGLVWAAVRGLSLEEMARWGVAAGTAAAMQPGVNFGTRSEVEAVYREVSVE